MAYYAFEILIALVVLFFAFLLYRVLVNSPRFTRFIERTRGTADLEIADLESRIQSDKKAARQVSEQVLNRAQREADAARRLRDGL